MQNVGLALGYTRRGRKLVQECFKQGVTYFQAIRKDEMVCITGGLDASAEYQKKYLAAR